MHLLPCILVFGLLVAPSVSQDHVEKVADLKAWKKLLRTRTSVLALFLKSEKSTKKVTAEFRAAAVDVMGVATVATVDCGGDSAKLCKKLKISPSPLLVQHYQDGELNKEYDRSHNKKSIINFLKDPTGDLPWEEDESAKDVVHIQSLAAFEKLLSKTLKPMLIMFYAPWCGHCKRLKPEYSAAATQLKPDKMLVGVDVDKPEMMPIRESFNISGFPTIVYFEGGKPRFPYGGGMDKQGIISWLANPEPPKEPEKEVEWAEQENDVVHLTSATFDEFIQNNPSVMVMFYAPWCGHCKKMKPDYENAASQLKTEKIDGVLAAVDATQHSDIGSKYEVKGYPTVWYFKDGEAAWKVNERTQDTIVKFMSDPKEPPPPPAAEAAWSETESQVEHLDGGSFQSKLKKKKHALIMFYAPWCGHCKKAKPHFTEAATKMADDIKVLFGAVDCTEHSDICSKYDVKGYPTLIYYNYGKNPKPYEGAREEADFIRFMENPENPKPALPAEQSMWEGLDGAEHVVKLTNKNFEQFIRSNPSVLVMFYAPWCGHCKNMKPDYVGAAKQLFDENTNGVLASVDATIQSEVAEKYGVKGFPTLKYFKEGSYAFDFDARSQKALVDFMKKPNPPEPAAPVNMWENTDGADKIAQLTDETFEEFITSNPSALVMFYAPWCGHCKTMKPQFAAAAAELADHEGQLAAVDCTSNPVIRDKYEIKGYPTLKYFRNGVDVFKYNSKRDKDSLVDFMKNPPSGEETTSKDEL